MFELLNFAGCFARGPWHAELRRSARAVASLLLILALSVAGSALARASEEGAQPSGQALQLAYLLDSAVTAEIASAAAAAPSGPATGQTITLADALADLAWRQATSRKLRATSASAETSQLSF